MLTAREFIHIIVMFENTAKNLLCGSNLIGAISDLFFGAL